MVAIALHSIVPIRAEAREGAEQHTQMLFGELCTVLEQKTRWNRVKLESDGQEGWVDAKMITLMSEAEEKSYRATYRQAAMIAMPMTYAVSENNGQTIPLTAGTRLNNYKNGRFEILGVGFRIDPSMVITQPVELNQENLLNTLRFFINIPYLWGGKNAMGMDCSGFTQVVMSLFGKKLLRNASEQATQGTPVPSLDKAKAGDLAFFDHEDGKICHVGILIDSERIIHCSGRVKVEKLDSNGIINIEQGGYSHHLVSIISL
jgi:cell wall-associated NlpC family hydrolase